MFSPAHVFNSALLNDIPSVMMTFVLYSVSFLRQNNMQRHSKKCISGQEKSTTSGKGKRMKRRKPAIPKEAVKRDGIWFQTNWVLIWQWFSRYKLSWVLSVPMQGTLPETLSVRPQNALCPKLSSLAASSHLGQVLNFISPLLVIGKVGLVMCPGLQWGRSGQVSWEP